MNTWHSIFHRTAYKGNDPAFYANDNFEWTNLLENNWLTIKNELDVHISLNPQLHSIAKTQHVNFHGAWKTMPLFTWGVEFHKNLSNFPQTAAILKQVPGLVSASFNLLEKNAEIKSHFGETNASVRAHLGLYVPASLPDVGLEVNGVLSSWKEGKVVLFCDGYEHSAWNRSEKDRYILLLDVIKPEFIYKKRLICANVLATLSLQSVASKSKRWFSLLFIPLVILHFIAKVSAVILMPLYNFCGRLKFQKGIRQHLF